MSYLIHINGHPGVGKLTVAQLLCDSLGARLLDNHSIYNVALALTEFKSDVYFETIRAIREIAYARILDLPAEVPVILTNAHFKGSNWGEESWDRAISLAAERKVPLLVVVLRCSRQEIERRVQGSSRIAKRKPRSIDVFPPDSHMRRPIDRGDHVLHLDTSDLSPQAAAESIKSWVDRTIREISTGGAS